MSRVSFIDHKDKRIIFFDFSKADTDEFLSRCEEAKKAVKAEGKPLLYLVDVSGAPLNNLTKDAIKALAVHNNDYSIATAVIGVTGLKQVIFNTVRMVIKRNMQLFDNHDDASDWLIEQS